MKLAKLLTILTYASTLLMGAANALARAGGGEGYHGGGGGGGHGGGGFGGGGFGGHGGGGGDDGGLIRLLIWLLVTRPAIGIPVTIAIVVFVIYSYRNGADAYQTSVIRRGSDALDARAADAAVASLRSADPNFDPQRFIERVTGAFQKIQSAWAQQNLQTVRPFLSDGVYERFSLQLDEQRALGYRNDVAIEQIDDVRILQSSPSRLFDVLALRIAAEARDVRVSLADGRMIPGSDNSGPFVEIWSLLRRRGVVTADANKPGLLEGNCPNCGASIEMNQNANCAHCGALLRSGQFDWVLAEITQESEWSQLERAADALPGVARMLNSDPDFDLQDLEDRASVMFWRRCAAERIGKVDPLRKIAAPEFCDTYGSELKAQSLEGRRQYYGDCAVGSVDTLGVVSDDRWDRALVEVRWSGSLFIMTERGPQETGRPTLARMVLELSRRAGVKSDAGRAISSAHCPNCGAPETGGTSGVCESCGTALNDGTRGWVLTAVRSPADARQLLAGAHADQPAETDGTNGIAAAPSASGLLAWMVQMALADGQIDDRESRMIYSVADRRGMGRDQVDAIIAAAQHGQIDLPTPSGRQESEQWLTAMATAALADGKITSQEQSLLVATARRVGLAEEDVRLMLQRIRADWYARSKQALRESKS